MNSTYEFKSLHYFRCMERLVGGWVSSCLLDLVQTDCELLQEQI